MSTQHYFEETLSEQDYDHVVDHLTGLLEDIYETGCVEDLEFHLEQVLAVFGMKAPQSAPKLMRKPSQQQEQTDRMLKAWVGYTRAYADLHTNKIKL